jgi:recombinational DNA repair protein (RecF pathway)
MLTIHAYILKRVKTSGAKMVLNVLAVGLGRISISAYQSSSLKKIKPLQAYTLYEMNIEQKGGLYFLKEYESIGDMTSIIYTPDQEKVVSCITKLILKRIPENFRNNIFVVYDEVIKSIHEGNVGPGLAEAYFIINLLKDLGLWSSADELRNNELFIGINSDIIKVIERIDTSKAKDLFGLGLTPDMETRVLFLLERYMNEVL